MAVILTGERMPGMEGGARLGHRLRGRDMADARSADSPRLSPADAVGLVVLPVSVHAFPLGQLAPTALRPG